LSPDPLARRYCKIISHHSRAGDLGSSCEEGIEDCAASWVVVAWPEKKIKKSRKPQASSNKQA